MDPALISTAETRRDERPGLDALEAVATKYFILLLPHMSDVLAGGDPLEEHPRLARQHSPRRGAHGVDTLEGWPEY